MLLPLPSKNVEEGAPSIKTMPCRSDSPRLAFLRSAQQTLISAHSSLQRASQVKPDINPYFSFPVLAVLELFSAPDYPTTK